MAQRYIETTNFEKAQEFENMTSAHLDGIYCKRIVDILEHKTEDKWLIDMDLIDKSIGKIYKTVNYGNMVSYVNTNDEIDFVKQNEEEEVLSGYDLLGVE